MRASSGLRLAGVLAAAASAILIAGCQPTVSTHGHAIDPTVLGEIQPGVTSREEVTKLLGSPSTADTFTKESWYYISQRSEVMSFYQADITQQDVVRITFDANGIVDDVNTHGLELAQAVTPDGNRTRTMGNELTVVQQFISNIGRFNPDQNAGPAPSRTPGGY